MLRDASSLTQETFDCLIIGGGIYGAWTAYDAALRGLRVAIIDKEDWAAGTSSSSSKLIHGGLRYLEYGHIGLVRKSLQERKRLIHLAPHRVQPLRFILPLTPDGRAGKWTLKAGLWLYDFLAGGNSSDKNRYFSADQARQQWPWLTNQQTQGAFTYSDAVTDDARLTLELISGAMRAGACAVNHVECLNLERDQQQRIVGALAKDQVSQREIVIRAHHTIVMAGPWCDRVLQQAPGKYLTSKGVHIILPPLPDMNHAALLQAPQDKRVFFLIPWYGATMVGTTDTHFTEQPEKMSVSENDLSYLLHAVQHHCPTLNISSAHIRGSFVGLRTLVAGGPKQVGAMSREWLLDRPQPGIFVSYGGKLTSARVEAEKTVTALVSALGKSARPCATGNQPLPWTPLDPWPAWKNHNIARGKQLGLDEETAATAVCRYGNTIGNLWQHLESKPEQAKRIDPRYPFCVGEIAIAQQHEMAMTKDDVFRRRIPLTILGSDQRELFSAR
jgi:glycerol-3-phosphate dehydrogenase